MELLPAAGRAVFLVMARTYRGLLDAIERRDYDVFSGRVSLSKWRKLLLVASPARALGLGVMSEQANRVLILGGGLAGLATATALAPRGFRVTLLEGRDRLGGRASSFQDATTGQLIDTCQHVSMGCCTNYAHLCHTLGIAHLLQPQKSLFFLTPDRRVSPFAADPWPAPLHLLRSFATAHYLPFVDKVRIAYGLACLRKTPPEDDPPFHDWLRQHHQSVRAINRFWGLVLISALNETPDRIGLRYARKVFVDGFLSHPPRF